MLIMIIFLLMVSMLLLLIYLLRTGNNILNVCNIISQHFKIIKIDIFTFIIFTVIPLTTSIGCVFIKKIDEKMLNIINNTFPIYIGVQFLIISIICRFENKNTDYEEIRKQTVNEILFEVILLFVTHVISIILSCVGITVIGQIMQYVISLCIYYLLFNVILSMFVIIKRIKFLFEERR